MSARIDWDRYVSLGREWSVACMLSLFALHSRYIPPLMGVAFALSVVHLARHWRAIPLRHYWPLLFLPLFYLLSLARIPSTPLTLGEGVAPMLRLGYVLAPIIAIDLRPSRLWGSALTLSAVLLVLLATGLSVYHSLELGGGGLRWDPFIHSEDVVLPSQSAWERILSGFSHFFYTGYTRPVGLYPNFMGYILLVSLIITVHRASSRGYRWRMHNAAMSFVLLAGLLMSGSRTMYLAGFLCLGLTIVHAIVRGRLRGWQIVLLAALFVGLSWATWQNPRVQRLQVMLQGGILHNKALAYHEDRIFIWSEAYKDRDHFLPWGLGTSSSRDYVFGKLMARYAPEHRSTKMHNELLEALVELGWLGFGLMLIVKLLPLARLWRFRAVELLLLVPLHVLMVFESMSSIAIGVASLSFCTSLLWASSIWRHRGLGDGKGPHV